MTAWLCIIAEKRKCWQNHRQRRIVAAGISTCGSTPTTQVSCQSTWSSNGRQTAEKSCCLKSYQLPWHNCKSDVYHVCLCYILVLASCIIYAQTLLEYVNLIVWMCSVNKMLTSVTFVEYKVLTFLTLREKC